MNATKEELLEYARKNYPIGTVFKTLCGSTYTIKGNNFLFWCSHPPEANSIHENNTDGLIRSKGKWAEIIKSPNVEPKLNYEVY